MHHLAHPLAIVIMVILIVAVLKVIAGEDK
jgi:hypothetical protein